MTERHSPFFTGLIMSLSLYVHIPFCASKCVYCDFPSGYKPEPELVGKYVAALCREMEIFSAEHPDKNALTTVYIGGGTPSLLDEAGIKSLMESVRRNFSFRSVETTIEANPDDVTAEKAAHWKDAGFDRVSLGVQSMEPGILKLLGRRNSPEQNLKAFGILKDAGFKNVSADWICGIRGENNDTNIPAMMNLRPAHFSVYHLTLEEKTLLHARAGKGEYVPLNGGEVLDGFWRIAGELENAGFRRYEISNFALPGFESRHNLNYWNYGEYIGIGLGASGFLRGTGGVFGRRWTNHATFRDYFSSLENGGLPSGFAENLGLETAFREFVMLGLRKADGIRYHDFFACFGREFHSVFREEKIRAMADTLTADGAGVRLTKRGVEVSNRVIRDVWESMI